ncbi:hypothetical protein GE09DRAFT_244693 [Coniochaeta sp. 2T2.1]|nr:hypothetical protein GE09DRAFT_244693 [Coniochaeta sp. 2T2.1]
MCPCFRLCCSSFQLQPQIRDPAVINMADDNSAQELDRINPIGDLDQRFKLLHIWEGTWKGRIPPGPVPDWDDEKVSFGTQIAVIFGMELGEIPLLGINKAVTRSTLEAVRTIPYLCKLFVSAAPPLRLFIPGDTDQPPGIYSIGRGICVVSDLYGARPGSIVTPWSNHYAASGTRDKLAGYLAEAAPLLYPNHSRSSYSMKKDLASHIFGTKPPSGSWNIIMLRPELRKLLDNFLFGLKPYGWSAADGTAPYYTLYGPKKRGCVMETLLYEFHWMPNENELNPQRFWPWKRRDDHTGSLPLRAPTTGQPVYLDVHPEEKDNKMLALEIRWVVTQLITIAGGVDVMRSLRAPVLNAHALSSELVLSTRTQASRDHRQPERMQRLATRNNPGPKVLNSRYRL